jgi:enoyl-CoA hydratase/carnithine racemase
MSETTDDFLMTGDEVLYEVSDRIATITLNRPDRMNAVNATMPFSLAAAMKKAADDPAVRVIILTGAGRAFCSGADMERLAASSAGAPRKPPPQEPLSFFAAIDSGVGPELGIHFRRARAFAYLIRIGKPIIAALNGPAAGIGFVLAAFCDLRFASDNFLFTAAFGQRGRIAEHGITWLLPRLIGQSNAADVLLSSRKVRAAEAKEMGFVNKVFAADKLMEETRAYAKILAHDVSPHATAVMKAQLWKSTLETFADSALEADIQTELIAKHPDYKEGVAHFVEKRPAQFADFKRGWRSSN